MSEPNLETARRTTRLKNLFRRANETLVVSGPSTVVVARVMESLGFEALYIGASNVVGRMMGRPDNGSITMTESVMFGKWFAEGVNIPVWVDTDACFGGPVQVERTVREMIAVGVAGITIEDQPFFEKRYGGAGGKQVIPINEAVEKYRVALATRDSLDPDFQIVARCDALTAENGGGVDGAIERLRIYKDIGADLLYFEGPRSFEELAAVRKAVDGPLMCTTYNLPRAVSRLEATELGLSVVHTSTPGSVIYKVQKAVYAWLQERGPAGVEELDGMITEFLRAEGNMEFDLDGKDSRFAWTGSGGPGPAWSASIARPQAAI